MPGDDEGSSQPPSSGSFLRAAIQGRTSLGVGIGRIYSVSPVVMMGSLHGFRFSLLLTPDRLV